jgi:hypothetical protein
MKFPIFAAAAASASILKEALASPLQARHSRNMANGQKETNEREGFTAEEKEAIKYFHEPGYVPSSNSCTHPLLSCSGCSDALPCRFLEGQLASC